MDDGEEDLQLSLWPFDDDLCTDVSKVWNINYVIRDGDVSWQDVDLKITREFVAVMTCATSSYDTDSFMLVDWKDEEAYEVSKVAVTVLRPFSVTMLKTVYLGSEQPSANLCSLFLLPRPRHNCPCE
jgi:hypothetical protein